MKFGMGIGLKNARNYNADYALEFNGIDEYLTRALPTNLLTNGTFETGVNTDNWNTGATATYNDTETGKTGNYCCKIIANAGGVGIHKDNFLTVGKKYKLTLRFKSTCDLRIGRNGNSTMYGLISATSQWNTVVRTFTVDANGLFLLYAHTAGTIWIDDISITEDWKLDLNESHELIKHSINRDFEQTLGAELSSGTVTIGKKYFVTAGTVEGNAVGTEFLAVTATTTLDASNKVREIPNLVTNGTFDSDTGWNKGTGWSISGGVATHIAGTASSISLAIASIINPRRFITTYTVSNRTTGSINIQLSGGGGGKGTTRSANGTFTEDITPGTTVQGIIYIVCSADFDGSVDNIHIYELPDYISTGNHSLNYSTADKYAGTGSLKVTATGAGDSGSNYVSLPSANIDSLVVGNKYTYEFFAKTDPASLTYGSNLLSTIGSFETNDGSIGSGWSKKIGSETVSIVTGNGFATSAQRVESSGSSHGLQSSTNVLLVNKSYKIVVTYRSTGLIRFYNGSSGQITTLAQNTGDAITTTIYLPTQTGNSRLYILTGGNAGNWFEIDDIKLYEATTITYTKQIGTKSVTITPSISTYTKGVLNFEASASEVGQGIKMYLSGAGSVYVDNVSLTQAYDVVRCYKFKVTNAETSGESTIIMNGGVGAVDAGGMWSYYNLTTNNLVLNVQSYDYKASNSLSSGFISRNILTSAVDYWDRTTALRLYINGVLKASGGFTNFGKVLNTHSTYYFKIGHWATSGTPKFQGQISHIQILRFTNIGQSNFDPTTYKIGQSITGGGAESVLLLDFGKDKTSMTNILKDWSGNGNSVTGVNVDQTNVIRKV